MEGDPAGYPLSAETAVGRDDQPLRGHVLQGPADQVSHLFRGLNHGIRVVHDPDGDLFGRLVLAEESQVLTVRTGEFKGNDIGIHLQQMWDSFFVRWI